METQLCSAGNAWTYNVQLGGCNVCFNQPTTPNPLDTPGFQVRDVRPTDPSVSNT